MSFIQYEVLIYRSNGTVNEFKVPYTSVRYLFETVKQEFLKPGTDKIEIIKLRDK